MANQIKGSFAHTVQTTPDATFEDTTKKSQAAVEALIQIIIEAGDSMRHPG